MIRKITLIFFIGLLALSVGCAKKEEVFNQQYNGVPLKIAVTGIHEDFKLNNVSFVKVNLSDLIQSKETFDALIVTKESFTEADKEEYVSLYNSSRFPVFFYGMENLKMFTFTNKNSAIDKMKYPNTPYVQGYYIKDGKKKTWNLSLPENATSIDKKERMVLRICDIVNQLKKGN